MTNTLMLRTALCTALAVALIGGFRRPLMAHSVSYGLDLNFHDRNIGIRRVPTALRRIHRTGATVVRVGVGWQTLEPRPGHFRWNLLDRLLQLLHRDHLRILLEIGDTPRWDLPRGARRPGGRRWVNYPPRDCRQRAVCPSAATYVTALIRHIDAVGAGAELAGIIPINEPQNFAKNWVGGTPAQCAAFQQTVHDAVHAVNPHIPVLDGGVEMLPPGLLHILARYAHPYARRAWRFAQALYTSRLHVK